MTITKDMSVIITGGASGIGGATARQIAKGGGHVGIIDINKDAAEALAKELGAKVSATTASVTDEAEIRAAVAKLSKNMPPVNGLVNSGAKQPTRTRIEDLHPRRDTPA